MMKLELLAIRTCLGRARLLGLVVSMAACDPSVYTREPMAIATDATGGNASAAVPGGGGAFQLQGDVSGATGGARATAPLGSGGSQAAQAPSSAGGISGAAGASAATATGGASRSETGGASGGQGAGGSEVAHDAASGGSAAGGAGTAVAGSGGASAAAGHGGGGPSAAGGSAAGGSGPTGGGGGRDVAEYNFELSVSGWQMSSDSGSVATLTRDTSRPFVGTASLEGAIVTSAADLLQVFVQSPAVAPGSHVTFHFFVPIGAPIDWVEPYIQEGKLSTPPFAWTYAYLTTPELIFGAWNTVTVALATGATAPISMGVQFHVSARWMGSVFVDSISW